MTLQATWKEPPKIKFQATGFVERRAQPRLDVKKGAFALLSLTKVVVGQITDINAQGLSFRYVASGPKVQGQCLVDIMMRDGNFHCRRLPCETVWDHSETGEFSNGPFSMRSCGLRFKKLTAAQKSGLECFLQEYTVF